MGDLYKPTGELQGDTRAMPNRGTATGMTPNPFGSDVDNVGHDLGADATNTMGSIASACRSDGKEGV